MRCTHGLRRQWLVAKATNGTRTIVREREREICRYKTHCATKNCVQEATSTIITRDSAHSTRDPQAYVRKHKRVSRPSAPARASIISRPLPVYELVFRTGKRT